MTELEVIELGFKKVKTYEHDQYVTNRYQKGVLEIEFTYNGEKLEIVNLTIQEIFCMPITKNEIKQLDKILNKN